MVTYPGFTEQEGTFHNLEGACGTTTPLFIFSIFQNIVVFMLQDVSNVVNFYFKN